MIKPRRKSINSRPSARLYVEQDLSIGVDVLIRSAQVHYLKNVLRLEMGNIVAIFNGRDGEWLATINGLKKEFGSLKTLELRRKQLSETDVWLIFAPIKRSRLDFLVQKASELGATALLPVKTQNTVVTRLKIARLRANAVEAAEQCDRLTLPRIENMCLLDELLRDWPEERRILLCAESGPATPIAKVLRDTEPGISWAVRVGPEGGFSKSELDVLSVLPFVKTASLGPRLLRSDTAAIAALSCWQAILGDWQSRPQDH